jgi:hypothetical protein
MSRSPPNPTGKGGWVKGQSGNPTGRKHRQITNLGLEARKWTDLALTTLVDVCRGEIRGASVRNRLTAAMHLLDRGYGRPIQAVDLVLLGKRLSELSTDELIELNARLATGGAGETEQPQPQPETLN